MAEKTKTTEGTHGGRRRPAEGWPNCKDPEVSPGKGIRKARANLAKRIKQYDDLPANLKGAYRKPGSLKVR